MVRRPQEGRFVGADVCRWINRENVKEDRGSDDQRQGGTKGRQKSEGGWRRCIL